MKVGCIDDVMTINNLEGMYFPTHADSRAIRK